MGVYLPEHFKDPTRIVFLLVSGDKVCNETINNAEFWLANILDPVKQCLIVRLCVQAHQSSVDCFDLLV